MFERRRATGGGESTLVKGQLVGCHTKRKGDAGRDDTCLQAEIAEANAGETGFFTLRILVGEKSKRLVFFERAAESEAALRACIRLFDGIESARYRINLAGKGIARLKCLVSEIAKSIAVEFVSATLGDNIDHTTTRAPVLGIVVAQN